MLTLRLYVAGESPNSSEARANLTALLAGHPPEQYELEIIDFLREPHRALEDGVIVTPTLVKLTPLPLQRIIGTLCERPKVLAALGIADDHHG